MKRVPQESEAGEPNVLKNARLCLRSTKQALVRETENVKRNEFKLKINFKTTEITFPGVLKRTSAARAVQRQRFDSSTLAGTARRSSAVSSQLSPPRSRFIK
ncbi:hypothetical protein NDU88_003376 [Pleurodeles waltl]|uniref:Uncharacterized protein n=1 Tax=Pleurodeles waltl TaxID=8319 RepID=A0AAV7VFL6_PLEWA|nr:hypothetical protein NDU88_003376 [Pleurodeles waltl]